LSGALLKIQGLIICLLSLSCFGQAFTFRDPAFVGIVATPAAAGGSFSPTNIAGVASTGWWVADNITAADMTSDGKNNMTNWTDTGQYHYTLTNRQAGANKWPTNVVAGVNGHNYMRCIQSSPFTICMNTSRYTNNTGYHEIVMVARVWEAPILNATMLDSNNGTDRNLISFDASAKIQIRTLPGGSYVGNQTAITNKWMVFDFVFAGASSGWFSNNICASGVVNPGTGPCDGLVIGGNSALAASCSVDYAEICTYSNALGTVPTIGTWSSSANRSNLYNYLTNKYAITQ